MAALSLPIKGVRETGDTIFALSSGSVPSAVAVVRISGSRAGEALRALIGRLPEARRAVLARVRDPLTAESIDQALALVDAPWALLLLAVLLVLAGARHATGARARVRRR